MENQFFNLEKIKELTSSIEVLQAKAHLLDEIFVKVETCKQTLVKSIPDENFLSQVNVVTDLMKEVKSELEKITKNNITSFLNFQARLFEKYKENFQEKLKKLQLDKDRLRKIGLDLIEKRVLSKTLEEISIIRSLGVSQWLEILDSLKLNSLFLGSLKKLAIYYKSIINMKLELELKKIPKDSDPSLIKEYKNVFLVDPYISFEEFLKLIEDKLTHQKLKTKKKFLAQAKQEEELEKLKKRQEEQRESYDDYLKLSDREFERKIRKKSREKLRDIKDLDKVVKKIEISDEITEKIEKFKSKFNQNFEEKYLIQKDEERDPLDLIRERKTKKKKEYKMYKDHFE